MGTLIAWVLVRDRFWGSGLLDVLIDIPFAMPTIVAGLVLLGLYGPKSPLGINVSNTRTSVTLALAFVTLPFIVRTVQPVLAELDADVEEAAASLGAGGCTILRRIVLPSLVPAIAAGAALSFARGDLGVRLAGAAQRHAAVPAPRWSRSGCCPSSRAVTGPPPPRSADDHARRRAVRDRRARHHPAEGGSPWLALPAPAKWALRILVSPTCSCWSAGR